VLGSINNPQLVKELTLPLATAHRLRAPHRLRRRRRRQKIQNTRGGASAALGAALGTALAFSDPATLPVNARRKAERASAALLAGQWDTAAEMLDDARDVAKGEPAAAAAASALDVMYALTLATDRWSPDGP
jgi:hypothetical protein